MKSELLKQLKEYLFEISLFVSFHIEIELYFCRFCFPDDSIIIACLRTHIRSCLRGYMRDRKILVAFRQTKQSSGINNARKHSTEIEGASRYWA